MMNSQTNPYVVAQSSVDERALFMTPLPEIMGSFLQGGGWKWLIILAGFMGVSYVAQTMANSSQSKGAQYAGLGLFVVGYSIIFVPLLSYAVAFAPDAIKQAAFATVGLFLGLTAIAFTTKKDFSSSCWIDPLQHQRNHSPVSYESIYRGFSWLVLWRCDHVLVSAPDVYES